MPHTLALATLSLCILGAGSQKADAKQPAAPVLTSVTSRSLTSVTLTWTVSDTRPGWFRVFYGTSSGNLASQADFDKVRSGTVTGLTTGFNKIFGQPVFDYIGTHPDLAPIFDAAMPAIHGHETAAMLEAYDFSGVHFLADIGGGNGSLIGTLLQRYPKLRGLLFELRHVAGRARESLKTFGVDGRCSVIEGHTRATAHRSMFVTRIRGRSA